MVLNHHLCYGDQLVTLITFQDGKAIFRDGKVGTEQGCCCEAGQECQAGCPSLDGCNLVVLGDFGDFQVEYINEPAAGFLVGADCVLAFEIADIPFESGGDISANATFGYDANCNPEIKTVTVTHSQDCNDPGVDCFPLIVTLACT